MSKRTPRYNADDLDFTTNEPSYYQSLVKINKQLKLLTERLNDVEKRFMDLLEQWKDDGKLDFLQGESIEYNWRDTELGVKTEDEDEYNYQDLQGEKGDQGNQGETGKSIEYDWRDTELGVRQEGESSYTYTDLKGEKGDQGDQGDTGKSIEYNWRDTELGVRQEGETSYTYTDLKGDVGAGLNILDELDNESQLPDQAEAGDAYLIDGELYVWSENQFSNVGNIKGVQGDTGKSIEYNWRGTELGVRQEGETSYQYQDLKGEKGDQGDTGKSIEYDWRDTELGVRQEGETSYTYTDIKGEKGDQGDQGDTGKSIEYNWRDTELGVRQEGDSSYTYTDLKGDVGDTGKSIEYNWRDTELGVRQEGDSSYNYKDLKGDKGDQGDTGKSIEYNWRGTELGVRQEGDSSYQYQDLKGEKGDMPQGAYINGTGGGTLDGSTVEPLEAGGLVSNANALYFGVNDRVYISDKKGYNDGGEVTYKPIMAESFQTPSGEDYVIMSNQIQKGYTLVSPKANEVVQHDVTFDQPFPKQPEVTASVNTTVPDKVETIGITNMSETGFTINLKRTNNTDTGVRWIAFSDR